LQGPCGGSSTPPADHRHIEARKMKVFRFQRLAVTARRVRPKMMVPWDDQQVDARGGPTPASAACAFLRADPHGRRHTRPSRIRRANRRAQHIGIQWRRNAIAGSSRMDADGFPAPFSGGLDPPGRSSPRRRRAEPIRPSPFEHAKAAEAAELDGELRRHQRVGRMRHHRNLETDRRPNCHGGSRTSCDDRVRRDGTILMSSSS